MDQLMRELARAFPTFRAAGLWLLELHKLEWALPWLGSTAGLVLAGLILRDFPWAERVIATPPAEVTQDARVAAPVVIVMIGLGILGLIWQIHEGRRRRADHSAQARFQRERAATKREANAMTFQTVADDAR